MHRRLFILVVVVGMGSPCLGSRHLFWDLYERTCRCDAIAVVKVDDVCWRANSGATWATYWKAYRASGRCETLEVLMGELPDELEILHCTITNCDSAHYELDRRYLVFLRRLESGRYVTVGARFGQNVVSEEDDHIDWHESRREVVRRSLTDVLREIKNLLSVRVRVKNVGAFSAQCPEKRTFADAPKTTWGVELVTLESNRAWDIACGESIVVATNDIGTMLGCDPEDPAGREFQLTGHRRNSQGLYPKLRMTPAE